MKLNEWLGYVFGVLFLIWVAYETYVFIEFRNNYNVTKAIVIGFTADGNGNPLLEVKYKIKGVEYTGSDYEPPSEIFKIGDSITIKYYNKDCKRIMFLP